VAYVTSRAAILNVTSKGHVMIGLTTTESSTMKRTLALLLALSGLVY
jgi:hypothetical protein